MRLIDILIATVLLFVFSFLYVSVAKAQGINYDQAAEDKKIEFYRHATDTIICMRQANTISIRAGIRETNTIVGTSLVLCRFSLEKFMVERMNNTPAQADENVTKLAIGVLFGMPGVRPQ